MELLAPAGNIDNFQAAIEAGADAVYVGAPGFNARNLARDLRLEEIGAMISYCHKHGKKVYLAANSLVLERELPLVVETLALLETLNPDALIVQDLGITQLVREHFPGITLHASTLMTAHNKDSVKLLSVLGCKRVVLARELTMKEIASIVSNSEAEIEVFVHGAMCYSYSGLCMFSSYLGGKSGLRGRCVQPCRRKYTNQVAKGKGRSKKGGAGSYLFSMNDLSAFQVVPALREAGVVSLKIEGRLRSAHYVSHVVQAYRKVLDASPEEFDDAVEHAVVLAQKAMSRRVSAGYFFTPQPQDAIVPYHSGNVGMHLGCLSKIEHSDRKVFGFLKLKETISAGDRLRIHIHSTGENTAFSLKEITVNGEVVESADQGKHVKITLPPGLKGSTIGKTDVYKVDVAGGRKSRRLELQIPAIKKQLQVHQRDLSSKIREISQKIVGTVKDGAIPSGGRGQKQKTQYSQLKRRKGGHVLKRPPLEFWLKTENLKHLQHRWPYVPDHFLIPLDRRTVGQASQVKKILGKGSRKVVWALPPVLLDSELKKAQKNIRLLMRNGFKSFQVGHLSQVNLFGNERVHLYGDYFLNILNSQSVALLSEVGFAGLQLSIESDQESLSRMIQGTRSMFHRAKNEKNKEKSGPLNSMNFGLTVYGAPPLFTSRLSAEHFNYSKVIVSPKDESFSLLKKEGVTQVVPKRPFSLLPYLSEIKGLGVGYMIVDITGISAGKKELDEIGERMIGKGRLSKLPTFNYLGKLE